MGTQTVCARRSRAGLREVTVERTVPAKLSAVATRLTPSAIIANEGRFTPAGVSASEDRVIVSVEPSGRILLPRFVFERRGGDATHRYRDSPPDSGRRAGNDAGTFHLTVKTLVPLPPVERYLAWRRGHALERVCDRLEMALR